MTGIMCVAAVAMWELAKWLFAGREELDWRAERKLRKLERLRQLAREAAVAELDAPGFSRTDPEGSRTSAEGARGTSEGARGTSEAARGTSEGARGTSEAARSASEAAPSTSGSARAVAASTRPWDEAPDPPQPWGTRTRRTEAVQTSSAGEPRTAAPAVMFSTPHGEKLHLFKECATLADSRKFKQHDVCQVCRRGGR